MINIKTFKEYISCVEDMAIANSVGDGTKVAGLTGDPVKKKGLLFLTKRNKNSNNKDIDGCTK